MRHRRTTKDADTSVAVVPYSFGASCPRCHQSWTDATNAPMRHALTACEVQFKRDISAALDSAYRAGGFDMRGAIPIRCAALIWLVAQVPALQNVQQEYGWRADEREKVMSDD